MSLYYDLPVFKDVYALTLRLFQLTQNFSREYKFTLGQDMKRDSIGKQITGWRNASRVLLFLEQIAVSSCIKHAARPSVLLLNCMQGSDSCLLLIP